MEGQLPLDITRCAARDDVSDIVTCVGAAAARQIKGTPPNPSASRSSRYFNSQAEKLTECAIGESTGRPAPTGELRVQTDGSGAVSELPSAAARSKTRLRWKPASLTP
jgi:hypothetical protein